MKKKIGIVLSLPILALSGCGSEEEASFFSVATDDPLITKTLPSIRQVCPGLDKYSKQFENVRTESHFRPSIVFDIPESARIPDSYKAGGHSCFIEVAPDGRSVFIEKLACKSICLDQRDSPEGQLQIALDGK